MRDSSSDKAKRNVEFRTQYPKNSTECGKRSVLRNTRHPLRTLLYEGYIKKNVFNYLLSAWPVEYIIYTAAFPSALTGSDLAIFAGCFAYIADVSSIKTRTLRVGILDVVYLSTMPTGVAIGEFFYLFLNRLFVFFALFSGVSEFFYEFGSVFELVPNSLTQLDSIIL